MRQRIAGKSLPFEKLAGKKSMRFLAHGERAPLAALELIYMWNGFRQVKKVLTKKLLLVKDSGQNITKIQDMNIEMK